MPDFEFDMYGNVKPYTVIPFTIDEFKQAFVIAFPDSDRRGMLFDIFLMHPTIFRADIDEVFWVWVGGSFVTRKTNPSDIDFVIFLDVDCYNRYEAKVDLLRKQRYLPAKLIDGYFVQLHPVGHSRRNWYESDRLRWLHDFGTSLAGRKKGIIELNFSTMDELTDILDDTDLRAVAIARLLTLIEQDSAIISRHRSVGESGLYVQQYVELREANLTQLAHLLEGRGTIRADLRISEQAA